MAEQVEEVKAGRELDALVAESVMGWVRSETQYGTFLRHSGVGAIGVAPLFGKSRGDLPHYSTDISAAWEVVEKMVSDGHVFIVKGDGLRTGDFSPRWTVLCCNLPRVDADSAPFAICKAALAAFMAE